MTDKRKVSFGTVSRYNGVEYKSGRIILTPATLEKFGITEDSPNILIKFDTAKNEIVIKADPT